MFKDGVTISLKITAIFSNAFYYITWVNLSPNYLGLNSSKG